MQATSSEQIEVLLPPAHLQGAVVCAIIRRIAAVDAAPPRLADVQANPYACLNVICEGTVQAAGRDLPTLFLTGPLTAPMATLVRGPLRSISIVMQPWLLSHAFKLVASEMVDQVLDLRAREHEGTSGLAAAAVELARHFEDAQLLWRVLDDLLARGEPITQPRLALDVLRSAGVRAAAQACALGERHYRRHFLHHMGVRPSAWLRISRMEALMLEMAAAGAKAAALSELALQVGYADQAHMTRESRSLVRQSPSRLKEALNRGSEAAWPLQAASPISSRRRRGAA
jgi:AraC-like DNA-binding protein